MPINISFDSNLTQNEADALRALLGTLQPAAEAKFSTGYPVERTINNWTDLTDEDLASTDGEDDPESDNIPTAENPDDFPPQASPIVDLDADGKEWDEAIHASTRTKTADGRWKKKRGVGKVEDEQAAAEEIEAGPVLAGIPTPPTAAPVPPPPPVPAADSGLPTFPETVKICSALGKDVYEKLFAEVGFKSVMEMRDDAALRERFFGHESVIKARMEKGV